MTASNATKKAHNVTAVNDTNDTNDTNEAKESIPSLTNEEKKALRGFAHQLEPIVYVGKEGFSPALLNSLEAAFKVHELIKVKIGQNCPVERNEAGAELAARSGAVLVQLIGRIVLLYRPQPPKPEVKKRPARVRTKQQARRRTSKRATERKPRLR